MSGCASRTLSVKSRSSSFTPSGIGVSESSKEKSAKDVFDGYIQNIQDKGNSFDVQMWATNEADVSVTIQSVGCARGLETGVARLEGLNANVLTLLPHRDRHLVATCNLNEKDPGANEYDDDLIRKQQEFYNSGVREKSNGDNTYAVLFRNISMANAGKQQLPFQAALIGLYNTITHENYYFGREIGEFRDAKKPLDSKSKHYVDINADKIHDRGSAFDVKMRIENRTDHALVISSIECSHGMRKGVARIEGLVKDDLYTLEPNTTYDLSVNCNLRENDTSSHQSDDIYTLKFKNVFKKDGNKQAVLDWLYTLNTKE
jgi:hypothetical protein